MSTTRKVEKNKYVKDIHFLHIQSAASLRETGEVPARALCCSLGTPQSVDMPSACPHSVVYPDLFYPVGPHYMFTLFL